MVPEQPFVIQIEVIVADDAVMAQGVVEGGIQMDILAVQLQNVPGVAVFDALFRVSLGDGDDAPQAQRVTEDFHRFGNALTYAHTLAQRADDLMGVRLFQLIVSNILTDEIMDVPLFFQRRHILRGPGQLFYPGGQSLLVVLDLGLIKQIFRQQLHILRAGGEAVSKPGYIENLRAVQPQLKKDIAELPVFQPGYRKAGGEGSKPGLHGVVCHLLMSGHLLVIIGFHRSLLPFCFLLR